MKQNKTIMILITNTFSKNFKKMKSIDYKDISIEIKKYKSWLKNFIELDEEDWNKILKWYLLSKKVRLLTYFQKVWWVFVPFYIVKKETKYWFNITSNLEQKYLNQLDKCILDIEKWDFEILEI